MFGSLSPKLKGLTSRLQQDTAATSLTVKGPPSENLVLAAGDVDSITSGGTAIGKVLFLRGGKAYAAGAVGLINCPGGAVNLEGAAGAAIFGDGGNVNITAGNATYGAAGTVFVTGGATANGTPGDVSITGGALTGGGGTNGSAVRLKGGQNTTGTNGGCVLIQPGAGTSRTGNINLDGGNGGALATNATGGFLTVSASAGTPTAAPSAGAVMIPTGSLVVSFDSTNNRAWLYNSVWKRANFGGAINSQSANYTCTLSDGGPERAVLHPSTDANARTFTIPANSSVAYDVGTQLTFINDEANAVTIAITTDTLVWEGTGATGSRTLARYGRAVATKISATRWYITGTNLT